MHFLQFFKPVQMNTQQEKEDIFRYTEYCRRQTDHFISGMVLPSKGILTPAVLELKAQSRTSGKLHANLITPYWSVKKLEIRRTCG